MARTSEEPLMATELVPILRPSCTLYELEDMLVSLVASLEDQSTAEETELVLAQIGETLRRTREKRDRVVGFLRHCEQQQRFADEEIDRIEKRKQQIGRVQKTLETYLVRLISEFAVPDRRGVRRLEGNVSAMRIQKNPDAVLIIDENAIPSGLKDLVLTIPAQHWEALLERLPVVQRTELERWTKRCETRPHKQAIARELKAGATVPGAELATGEFRLVLG